MSTERTEVAAQEIAEALFESEMAIEAALATTASVMTRLPAFKSEAGLTVFHAQDVIEHASDLVALLTQARRKAGELHRKLDATKRQIGLNHLAFGPVGKPPEQFETAMKVVPQAA